MGPAGEDARLVVRGQYQDTHVSIDKGQKMGHSVRRIRAASVWVIFLGAAAACARPALAQETGYEAAATLDLTGYAGLLTPLARLADQGDTLSAEFSTKPAFGAELDYWLPSGLGIGMLVGYSRPDLTLQKADPDNPFGTRSVGLGQTDAWFAMANVMYRPNLGGSAGVLKPYVGLGAGVISLSYPDQGEVVVEDETRFAGGLVGGAQLGVSGPVFARLDVRDYISSFDGEPFGESRLQNDIVISFGIGLRLR